MIKNKLLSYRLDSAIEVYRLDIDNYMVIAETIISKYINIPKGAIYVKGLRFPMGSRRDLNNYSRYGLTGDVPWHPFLIIPLLYALVEHYQYPHTKYPNLFITNSICDGVNVYDIPPTVTDENIISSMVPNITSEDLGELIEIFLNMYHMSLENIFNEFPNAIYCMDASTSIYKLLRYDDIRTYRYMECVENHES